MVLLWADWMETCSAALWEMRTVDKMEYKLVVGKAARSVVYSAEQSVVTKESYSVAHWDKYSVEKKGIQWADW
jgi:tricorn protease-like protein